MHSESQDSFIRVGVFPLPGMVAFEGQQHLLHIFEPRYRKLIQDCVDQQIPLGLALPQKQISKADNKGKSFTEILESNQNTYQASGVFGAGPVKILRVLPDGRILIVVNVDRRVRFKKMLQFLPYYLAEVEMIPTAGLLDQSENDDYFNALMDCSSRILKEKHSLFHDKISEDILSQKDVSGLLLKIMDWFRLDSEMLQHILELDRVADRAQLFIEYMELYIEQNEKDDPTSVVEQSSEDFPVESEEEVDGDPLPEEGDPEGKVIPINFRSAQSPRGKN